MNFVDPEGKAFNWIGAGIGFASGFAGSALQGGSFTQNLIVGAVGALAGFVNPVTAIQYGVVGFTSHLLGQALGHIASGSDTNLQLNIPAAVLSGVIAAGVGPFAELLMTAGFASEPALGTFIAAVLTEPLSFALNTLTLLFGDEVALDILELLKKKQRLFLKGNPKYGFWKDPSTTYGFGGHYSSDARTWVWYEGRDPESSMSTRKTPEFTAGVVQGLVIKRFISVNDIYGSRQVWLDEVNATDE